MYSDFFTVRLLLVVSLGLNLIGKIMSSSNKESSLEMSGVWAVVPAAGTSSRMIQSLSPDKASEVLSKIFLDIGMGRTVLHESLSRLYEAGIRNICIPTQLGLISKVQALVDSVGTWNDVLIIEGGKTRFQSVKKAMSQLALKEVTAVVIHDAARPFVSPDLICLTIREALEGRGAILGNPVTSTIKYVSVEGVIKETPNRELIWEAQTPQAFPFKNLYAAFGKVSEEETLLYDDASVFEAAGGEVRVFESPTSNIKVTTATDLALARVLLGERS